MFTRMNARHCVGVLALVSAVAFVAPARATPTSFGAFPNNSTHSNASVAAAIANVPTNAGHRIRPRRPDEVDIQVYNFSVLVYTYHHRYHLNIESYP